ncbi:hypothetical protein H0H92_015339, partial [Tricholoma furcatifolium]
MARPKNSKKAAAARARAGRSRKKAKTIDVIVLSDSSDQESEDDEMVDREILTGDDCTSWTGGVNHEESDLESDVEEDREWQDTESDDEVIELEGPELVDGLRQKWELRQKNQVTEYTETKLTAYTYLMAKKTNKEWTKAEAQRGLGYTGLSDRRKREINKELHDKEAKDKIIRN